MWNTKIIFAVLISVIVMSFGLNHDITTASRFISPGKIALTRKAIQEKLTENVKEIDPNLLVDNVLLLVDEVIQAEHLDPYEFADGEFLGAHYDAWIGGYSSMARLGDASIITGDNTVDITVQVEMTNLAGNFSFWFEVLGVTIDGGATATIANVDLKLALRFLIDPDTGVISPFVDDFQITTIGPIDVEVFGLGPFDYLADLVADFIVNLVKYLIPLLVDGVIKDIIQQVLDDIFSQVA